MQKQNKRDRPDLKFETMDATKMIYNEATFGVILDKVFTMIIEINFNCWKNHYCETINTLFSK